MTTSPEIAEQRPCWFVGASYGGTNDQTPRFLREGIWENGYQLEGDGRYFDEVNAMRPGDRIAIKSAFTQMSGLPFDNQGRTVSTMAIKAVGTITRNYGDGCRVEVDWTPVYPHRNWYFYTNQKTVWQVLPDQGTIPWAADGLIRFTFEDEPQDYQRFLDRWGWVDDPWDGFVRRAQEYVETGRLDSEENEYKIAIGRRLAAARETVLVGSDSWASLVNAGVANSSNNLMHYIPISRFHSWVNEFPDSALTALQALWTRADVSVGQRIRDFANRFPPSVTSGVGTRLNTISLLLMGIDAERYPPFRTSVFREAYQRTGYAKPDRNADEATLYEHALGFLDQFIGEAEERGLNLRHRLDAQSVVWAIKGEIDGLGGGPEEEEPSPPDDLQALADDVYLPVEFLEEIVTLLEDKKQVIFQGPPGTGKTYVAKELAKHLAGSEERVTLVQFHPSYAYEDFVQGFRPELLVGGQPGFELKDGSLLRAARKAEADAKKDPDAKHFLVIDEINRGNIAKVFGELYFLLEYRDEKMQLQYQKDGEQFSLPSNLYVIGTMNTADRSIALVDLALRRRFYFVEFHPDDEPVKSVLKKWLNAKGLGGMAWVADVVERTNEKLQDDRHAAIGPSYFMGDDLDDDAVERIWKHSVLPYIEERRFSGEQAAEEFRLDRLRREVSKAGAGEDGERSVGDGKETANDGAE